MSETTQTGEHQKDVSTVSEETKIPLKFAATIMTMIVIGLTAFLALQSQVNAQHTRITGLEKVMCAVAKKLDVLVAECGGS